MPFLLIRSWLGQTHHQIAYGERPCATARHEIAAGETKCVVITERQARMGPRAAARFYELGGLAP
jgi:hypothetical protein